MKQLRPASRIVLFSIFLALQTPDIFRLNRVIDISYTALRGVAAIVTLFLFLYEKKHSKMLIWISIYIVYLAMITCLRTFDSENIVRFVAIYLDIITLFVITEYLVQRDTIHFLKFFNTVAWIGLIINAISVFAFPNGLVRVPNEAGVLFPYFFFDYDNGFIVRYIPSIFGIFVHERYFDRNEKLGKKTALAILICTATLVYRESTASFLVMGLVLLCYCFIDFIPAKIVNIRTVWIVYLIVSMLIVFGYTGLANSELIVYLGKSTSLLKRTRMWTSALREIPKTLIFGLGVRNTSYMRVHFDYAQLHNTMLTTILWGGLIGLFLYSKFILSSDVDGEDKRHLNEHKFIVILFIAIMGASLFDGIELLPHIYIFYSMISVYKTIENTENHIQKKKRNLKISIK